MKTAERLIAAMDKFNKPHSLAEPPMKALGFKNTLQYLINSVTQQGRGATAIRMSAGGRYIDQMDGMLRYLADMEKVAKRVIEQTDRQIEQLGEDNTATRLEEQTVALYDEVIELLRVTSVEPQMEPQEVQP